MIKVVIIGAGGHGQVVADILMRSCETNVDFEPVAFLDDNSALIHHVIMGLPILGHIEELTNIEHDGVVIAIGDNKTRAKVLEIIKKRGEQLIVARHPSAVFSSDVVIGQGVMVCAGVIINTSTVIEENVILNTGSTIDHHNQIGCHAHIGPGVHLGGHVHVGEGSLIGIGSVVIPGCIIGEWAVVGAGSVVTRDVPARTTVAGSPAQIIKIHS